ncbi:MAG TPA: protoporphyrinogen oxidase, partial [Bryobacteraceae bacterium]|nr:protoporphyrinogen oxidase [Bryobacteraceae bacterium]
GCVVEGGPDSFLSVKPAARELATELGLTEELIGSNDSKRATWIWRDGRMVRMPEGMTMMVPGKLRPMITTKLLSWPGKLRAGMDLFRRPAGEKRDRSVSEFVIDHYGPEVLEYIAEPMLAGVYGGDPAEMSIGAVMPMFLDWEARYGSLTRAARAEVKGRKGPLFTTLRPGLQTLVDTLVAQLRPMVIRGTVKRIEKGWRVRIDDDWMTAEHVVIACRAHNVLPDLFPPLPYNSASVIAVGYRRTDVPQPLEGFGFLVPKVERKSVSAGTFVNNKFEGRAPADKILIRLFTTGGKADWRAEVREKLGITAEPLFVRENNWPSSMPQYNVGHAEKITIIEGMIADLPGLHIAGNAYYGIGIPDCIRIGKQVAERIATASQRKQRLA